MENRNYRVIIYPSDVSRWYGVKERAGYYRYRQIKLQLGIPNDRPLTIFHFSKYHNVTVEEAERKLFS